MRIPLLTFTHIHTQNWRLKTTTGREGEQNKPDGAGDAGVKVKDQEGTDGSGDARDVKKREGRLNDKSKGTVQYMWGTEQTDDRKK